MSKVIIITGTSTGLGISIAVQAAQAGHTVYATMRNVEKRAALDAATAAAGVSLNVIALDVQDGASVDAAVEAVRAKEGRIDVLINNAGVGFVRSTEQATEAEIDWVMDVNFMGVIRCTKAVIPHMRKARAGHIVSITSVGGLVGQPFNEIYCAAKFAVEGYVEGMASYITPSFGINFTCVEPGGISTEFAPSVLKHVTETGGMLEDEYIYQTADEVAAVVMQSVDAVEPPIRVRTSKWAEEFTALKTGLDPDGKKLQAKVVAQFLS